MRTRRRRLPRTRAAARLPGSLKFGVTGDASATRAMAKRGLLAEVHAIEQAQCSHQCLAPDPGYYLLMTLFNTTIPRRRAPAFVPRLRTSLSSRRPARMKIIAFSQRVLRAPGSGRAWTRDRPTGPRTLLVSYRSFRSSMRLMSSVYAAAKNSEYRVFYLQKSAETSQ